MRVVQVTNSQLFLHLIDPYGEYLTKRGCEVVYVAPTIGTLDSWLAKRSLVGSVATHHVGIARSFSPIADVRALLELWNLLRRLRPAVLEAHTPKAAALAILAAWLRRVPVRVYRVHGATWTNAVGLRRLLLQLVDWSTIRLATNVVCVSHSLREEYIAAAPNLAAKIRVPHNGSVAGIDFDRRFRDDDQTVWRAKHLRQQLGISEAAPVVGYVGRLNREKGIGDLLAAWQQVVSEVPDAKMLLVGPFDDRAPLAAGHVSQIRDTPSVFHVPGDWDTAAYYSMMDVLALPTRREGLGLVLLEAAAIGVPAVATRVPGCVDALVDGVTGTLIPVGAPAELAQALLGYLRDPNMCVRRGKAAQRRVRELFDPEDVCSAATNLWWPDESLENRKY